MTLSSERAEQLARIAGLDEESCCSFDEWRDAGYWVVRGEKSHFKDIMGVPQFTQEQVRKAWDDGDEEDADW